MHFKDLVEHLGAEVMGVDLRHPLQQDELRRIEDRFDERGVLLFRNQMLTEAQHVAFSRALGELEIHLLKQYLLPGHPEIIVISNMEENGKPVGVADAGRQWHTDVSYKEKPSRASLLYARRVPQPQGGRTFGDTVFVNTSAAYDALPTDMQDYLGTLRARHSYVKRAHIRAKVAQDRMHEVPEVTHPVIRTHPATGRKCIYVNEGFTTEIVGLTAKESDGLLQQLWDHCTSEKFQYRHRWQVGDLIMWDNCSTQHLAPGDYGPDQHRLMHRTTLAGTAVF